MCSVSCLSDFAIRSPGFGYDPELHHEALIQNHMLSALEASILESMSSEAI